MNADQADYARELCGRCLAGYLTNVTTDLGARQRSGNPVIAYPGSRDVGKVAEWVTGQISVGNRLEMYAQTDLFLPVSTWHGDLVCWPHLMELVNAAASQDYRRRR